MPTSWWNDEYDSSWERAKDDFRHDWQQTKHDLGGDQGAFDLNESALRFGHGARLHYGTRKWDDAFAQEVSKEYEGDWERDQALVKYSYDRTTRE
ncbi:hypothetical protein JST97_17820 [bacterium]|nr:hypothetical protein [bacterium]